MAKKNGSETVLAQCYLRYEKGKADPRHHAYLTQSKLFLRRNNNDYEMYSLKDVVGIKAVSSYLWPLIFLGGLLIIAGLANGKFGLFPTERPQQYYFNPETQTYEEKYGDPLEWQADNKAWESSNENWTGGLFMGGVLLFLTGLKKRSSLKLLMNSRELKFRVYVITNEYLSFVEALKSRLGHVPRE